MLKNVFPTQFSYLCFLELFGGLNRQRCAVFAFEYDFCSPPWLDFHIIIYFERFKLLGMRFFVSCDFVQSFVFFRIPISIVFCLHAVAPISLLDLTDYLAPGQNTIEVHTEMDARGYVAGPYAPWVLRVTPVPGVDDKKQADVDTFDALPDAAKLQLAREAANLFYNKYGKFTGRLDCCC